MRILVTASAALLLSASALAQVAKPVQDAHPPAAAIQPKLTDPVITPVQIHAIQNIDKLAKPLMDELMPLRDQRQEVINEIVAANPGYIWSKNPQTGTEGLAPKPAANPTPTPAPKK